MKSLAATILLITTTFFAGESAIAQPTQQDYVLTGGKHPTIQNAKFEYLFIPSPVPARVGKNRTGYVFELVYDRTGQPTQSKGGLYLAEQVENGRVKLTLDWEKDGVEIGQLGSDGYRILRHSKETERIGKTIALASQTPNKWTQHLIQKIREHNQMARQLLQLNQSFKNSMYRLTDEYGKKLGI